MSSVVDNDSDVVVTKGPSDNAKIRRRIQFFEDSGKETQLSFQFKHPFPKQFTFSQLLIDIVPKLGKKKSEFKDSKYLSNCIEEGTIIVYCHDGQSSKFSIESWDEVLDLEEQVSDVVSSDTEVLALLYKNNNNKLQASKNDNIINNNNNQFVADNNKKEEKKDEESSDILPSYSNDIIKLIPFPTIGGNNNITSLKVRFWDAKHNYNGLNIDVPDNVTIDQFKRHLSNIIGIKYRCHSSHIISNLNKYNDFNNNHCLCFDGNVVTDKKPNSKSSVFFYYFDIDTNKVIEKELKNIDFDNTNVNQLCKQIEPMYKISLNNAWLFVRPSQSVPAQHVTFLGNKNLSELGFKKQENGSNNDNNNNGPIAMNAFYCCGVEAHSDRNELNINVFELKSDKNMDISQLCDNIEIDKVQIPKDNIINTFNYDKIKISSRVSDVKQHIISDLRKKHENNIINVSDIRIFYQLPNEGGLITLDDDSKFIEFGIINKLDIFVYNVSSNMQYHNSSMIDTTIDLFSHSMKLRDNNPFKLIRSILWSNNDKFNNIVYLNPRWLYHNSSKIIENKEHPLRMYRSWIPSKVQTNRGMAAFLSVLKLLTHQSDILKNGILGRIYTLFPGFPCFLLSLKIALYPKLASQLTDEHKALLSNGFYYIARQVCPVDSVNDNQVFESFHAIMSHIIDCAVSKHANIAKECFKNVDLTCPISLERLHIPTRIIDSKTGLLKDEIYSKSTILSNDNQLFNDTKLTDQIFDEKIDTILKIYDKCDEIEYFDFENVNKNEQNIIINYCNYASSNTNIDDIKLNDDLNDSNNNNNNNNNLSMFDNDIMSKVFSYPYKVLCKNVGLSNKNSFMKIIPTLSILNLPNSKSRVLTVDVDGNLCVCQGILENFHTVGSGGATVFNNNRAFFRPLLKNKINDTYDLHVLADKASTVWPTLYKPSNTSSVIDDRIPNEAIIVCFDQSGSMENVFEKSEDNNKKQNKKKEEHNVYYVLKNEKYRTHLSLTGEECVNKLKVTKQPSNGKVTIQGVNLLIYEPNNNFVGSDPFGLKFIKVENNNNNNNNTNNNDDSDDDDDDSEGVELTINMKIVSEMTDDIKIRTKKDTITRLKAATIFFNAFINRSAAYDYASQIGLILFNDNVSLSCPISPLYEKFNRHCDRVKPNGETLLRDAIDLGISKLLDWKNGFDGNYSNPLEETNDTKQLKQQRKDSKLRIILLTDGVDNGSKISTFQVTKKLIRNDIIVDSVCIGDSYLNFELRSICRASGGYIFIPQTFRDGLRIFECETFITQSLRPEYNIHKLDINSVTLDAINRLRFVPIDICSDVTVPKQKQNEKMNEKSQSLQSQLNSNNNINNSNNKTNDSIRIKRIMREMKSLLKNPHDNWDIYPNSDDITFWKLVLTGPIDTPYQGGTWLLYLDFGSEYPMKPPKIRFDQSTPIKHVNVNGHGRICHSIFGRDYSSDVSIRDILSYIFGLMMHPDWDDPLDSVLRQQYADNKWAFRETIEQHTYKFAFGKSRQDYAKEFGNEED